MDFNSLKSLIAFCVCMLIIAIIAIITVIKTGNFEHVLQSVIAAALTLATAFGVFKAVKNGKKES